MGKERCDDFDAFYRRFFQPILSYIERRVWDRERALELTQDTFLKAFRAWDQYDPSIASQSTWLWTIARNTVIDFVRDREVEVEDFDLDTYPAPEGEDRLAREPVELSRRLDQLTECQRDIVELRLSEHLTYRQISERTNLSISAIKGLIFRAREALKDRT